jgi:hypothetical protein
VRARPVIEAGRAAAVWVVSSYTLNGFIQILLVIAIAVVLIRIIQGRRPL